MPLSDAAQTDPSMLGKSGYEREPLDFYPTPERTIKSLLSVIEEDLPAYLVWEPFCGDGAFSKLLEADARGLVSTDICAYEGFDPDGLFDFFKLENLEAIKALKGFTPDCIITNPPYGDIAEKATVHALKLMQPEKGIVIFLCRGEWDTAKTRAHLFDHPAFAMKIILRHRPRWIAGSTGGPRHSYAYYVWDWAKPAAIKPNLIYAK